MQRTRKRHPWWRRQGSGRGAVEGPLANPAAVVREEVRLDPSLLEEAERTDEAEPSVADLELAAMIEAETAADRAAEAEAVVSPAERNAPDSVEDFEEFMATQPATDEALQVEDALQQALRDEGPELDEFDPDEVEAEVIRRRAGRAQ
jgi:hypothetical protein